MVTDEICRLCQKSKPLKLSHIIPEFLYKTMYDDKHRFEILSTRHDQPNRFRQQGIYEKLLCGDCETNLSKWERYVNLLLNGGINIVSMREGNLIHLSEIDYCTFRLFQLSILWRASISTNSFFSNVSLGNHEDKIRKLIFSGDTGLTWQYGCLMIGLIADDAVVTDVMIQPNRFKLHGHTSYRFVFGGFIWIYFASNHKPPIQIQPAFLSPTGNMTILVKNIESVKDFESLSIKLLQNGKL